MAVYLPLMASMLGYDIFFAFREVGSSPPVAPLPRWARATAAVLAGALLQSFSFCTLHDASHYGLLFKVGGGLAALLLDSSFHDPVADLFGP